MYTLILIWSIAGWNDGGTESLTVSNLSYQECTQQINNFQAGAKNLKLQWSSCTRQEGEKQ